jgi:hypothetical protein
LRKAEEHYNSEAEEPETLVLFRRWSDEAREVFALFPLLPETRPGECVSYQHVGQHGAAHYSGCMDRSSPASIAEDDCASLARELESIGYRLRIGTRTPSWRRIAESRKAAGL